MQPLFAILVLDQDFDLTLGIFQDFQATLRETNAFLEYFQGLVQRQVTLFQFPDDCFQPRHCLFEFDPAHDGT